MMISESITVKNIHKFADRYGLMRQSTGMYLMWKVCEYFQPNLLLEIGFSAGQTFGLLIEATPTDAKYVSVDIDYSRRHVFDQLHQSNPKIKNIDFLEIDSTDFVWTGPKFDFIFLDGGKAQVIDDLSKCLTLLHHNSILCMDDYNTNEINTAITEQLLGQHNFVPFLAGDQEMFFHHVSHSADLFLDEWIQDRARNFMHFSNMDFHGFTVLRANTPEIFVANMSMWQQALKFYNL